MRSAQHPRFDLKSLFAHRATADIGLIKLKEPMAATPPPMAPLRPRIAPGERFVVHGYGQTVRNDRNSVGTLRAARLIATGHPGSLQLRLVDPATGDKQRGLGGCTGDSGAPAYQENDGRLAVIGVVSWASGPEQHRRLRRTDRRHAARALPEMDRRDRAQDGSAVARLSYVTNSLV